MRALPKNIIVRGLIYEIKLTPSVEKDDDECWGICDYEKQIIYIDSTLPRQMQWQTLFHEMTHAILRSADANKDEYFVDTFAGEYFATLRGIGLLGGG